MLAPGNPSSAASGLYGQYLAAKEDAAARQILNDLFSTYLVVWCRESVERNLGCYGLRNVDRADLVADVSAEVLLAMMTRLSASRAGDAEPVANVRAYLSSSAQNACFARIRARCPRHVQLQNRLRYVLRSDGRFASWESSDGELLAGLATWTSRVTPVSCPELQRTVAPLDEVLTGLLRLAGGPIRLSDAVKALSAAFGITDSTGPDLDPDSLASHDRSVDDLLADRETLQRLWSEVRELPGAQRSALLLNLRDASGNGVIELLPASGVASFAELAILLGMTAGELAGIWNDLPLEDARIAEILSLTRQQVINLRKSARERLGRRLKKSGGNTKHDPTSNRAETTSGKTGNAVGAMLGGTEQGR